MAVVEWQQTELNVAALKAAARGTAGGECWRKAESTVKYTYYIYCTILCITNARIRVVNKSWTGSLKINFGSPGYFNFKSQMTLTTFFISYINIEYIRVYPNIIYYSGPQSQQYLCYTYNCQHQHRGVTFFWTLFTSAFLRGNLYYFI